MPYNFIADSIHTKKICSMASKHSKMKHNRNLTSASDECSSLDCVKRGVASFMAKPKSHRHNDRSVLTSTLREFTSRWTTVGFTSPVHHHDTVTQVHHTKQLIHQAINQPEKGVTAKLCILKRPASCQSFWS